MQTYNKSKRILNVIVISIILIMSTITLITIIDKVKYQCPIYKIFNIYCAGCGTTRMLKELMKGNIFLAIKYNIAMFILLLITIIFYIYDSIYYIKYGKYKIIKLKTIYIIVTLLFVFMVLRNIEWFQFLQP